MIRLIVVIVQMTIITCSKTLYETLGIAVTANQADIKKAFRKLAIELHPDKIPKTASDEERDQTKQQFIECQQAYEILYSPASRAVYNDELAGLRREQPIIKEPDSRYMQGHFMTKVRTRKIKLSLEVQFSDTVTIPDIVFTINIPLSEVFSGGASRNHTYYYNKKCPVCNGNGGFAGECNICTLCNGTGTAAHRYQHHSGHFTQETVTKCVGCNGRGCTVPKRCSHCGGSGMALTEAWMLVDIPSGFTHKQAFTYKGMGHDSNDFRYNAANARNSGTAASDSLSAGNSSSGVDNMENVVSGDVVVTLEYEMPTGYSLFNSREGSKLDGNDNNDDGVSRKFDLMYNVSIPVNSLAKADDGYVYAFQTPSGENVTVAFPSNTSTEFSEAMLAGYYSHTLTGLGLLKPLSDGAGTAAATADERRTVQEESGAWNNEVVEEEEECDLDTQVCTVKRIDSESQRQHQRQQQEHHVSSQNRGDLVVFIEPSWTNNDDNDDEDEDGKQSSSNKRRHAFMSSLLSQTSEIPLDDPLFGRFFDIVKQQQQEQEQERAEN